MNVNTSAAVAAAGSNAGLAGSAGFKVDVTRGERVGRVSSEWFSRPDDERYLSLCRRCMRRFARGRIGQRRGRWRAGPSGLRRAAMMGSGWR